MNGCDWIICERTGHWAAALRVTLERHAAADVRAARIYEVRHLGDLAARLAARPDCLVAIEVDRANFAHVLPWLAAAPREFPRARFVALLDRSLSEDRQTGTRQEESREVEHALNEAGAAQIVCSPRQWRTLLALARRHAAACAADRAAAYDDSSPAERVWASLPWQDR